MRISLLLVVSIVLLSCGSSPATPETVTFSTPDLDQWAYPPLNGVQAGTWEDAALFHKMGADGREDRSGQLLVAYDLSSAITPGLGADNYCVTSVRLVGQVSDVSAESVVLDNTYDSYRTYLDPNDPNYVLDSDPGRSLELYGAGLAEGWTGFDFDGSDPNGAGYTELTQPGGFFNGPRQVFAASFDPNGVMRDVSNNIKGQFEADPWAVADSDAFSAGESILPDDLLTFDVDVSDPDIQAYLCKALDAGQVGFVISSLHEGSQTAGSFLRFFTKENLVGGMPVKLEIGYVTMVGDD